MQHYSRDGIIQRLTTIKLISEFMSKKFTREIAPCLRTLCAQSNTDLTMLASMNPHLKKNQESFDDYAIGING